MTMMNLNNDQVASAGGTSKEALLGELHTEYDRITARLRELQALTDQSKTEVQRLQKRSIDLAAQVKRVEDNLETLPRTEIKNVYNAALDSRTRLLTMQSQFEKFDQDRTQLERFSQLFQRLLEALENVPFPHQDSGGHGKGGVLGNASVVRIVEAQEVERQRLARQIHDGPAQSLTNFILQAEICQRLFDRDPSRAAAELNNLKTAASATFQKVRDFIFELRPMMLDDLGLAPTVQRYVNSFKSKSGVEVTLQLYGEDQRLEPHTEVTLFRAVQELLGYARDRSHASHAELNLDISGQTPKLDVSFNGFSIDESETTIQNSASKEFSIHALQERVELIGGLMDIVPAREEGQENHVAISLPL